MQSRKEYEVAPIRFPKHGQDQKITDSVTVYGLCVCLLGNSANGFTPKEYWNRARVSHTVSGHPLAKQKQKANEGKKERIAYVRGVDYKPDMEKIQASGCIFTFLEAKHMFDGEAKICSLYLRPWTLAKKLASATVPYLADLGSKNTMRRNWKTKTCNDRCHTQ